MVRASLNLSARVVKSSVYFCDKLRCPKDRNVHYFIVTVSVNYAACKLKSGDII